MKDDLTVEEMIRGLKDFKNLMQNKRGNLMLETAKSVVNTYKGRIFFDGLNAENEEIGQYGKYYSDKYKDFWVPLRKRKGLQVEYVDLKFTGKLYNSIKVKKDRFDAVVYINGEKEVTKAEDQEYLQAAKKGKRYEKMDIFSFTEEEVELSEKRMLENLAALIRNTIVG